MGAQGAEVGAIVIVHLPELTPWLGEEASQEQPQSVERPPVPQKGNINLGGKTGASSESGHRGGSDSFDTYQG